MTGLSSVLQNWYETILGGVQDRWSRVRSGRAAEARALRFLRKKGYRPIAMNARVLKDEADLVLESPDGSVLVIVEVKSRQSGQTRPEESVGRTKQMRLSHLAARMLARPEHRGKRLRFDVVGIEYAGRRCVQLRHYEGAFDSRW